MHEIFLQKSSITKATNSPLLRLIAINIPLPVRRYYSPTCSMHPLDESRCSFHDEFSKALAHPLSTHGASRRDEESERNNNAREGVTRQRREERKRRKMECTKGMDARREEDSLVAAGWKEREAASERGLLWRTRYNNYRGLSSSHAAKATGGRARARR